VTSPDSGAVQVHQTDSRRPDAPAWLGSPGSPVAPTLVPVVLAESPFKMILLAKLSFTGGIFSFSVSLEVVEMMPPPKPPTRHSSTGL